MNNHIVHLALKVDDLDKTTKFYVDVFGFLEIETNKTRDHLSRHLTDGAIDFALIKYDPDTKSAESRAAGDGPCIHHFAIEVADVNQCAEELERHGCEVISDPGVIPIKFRAPGGTLAEVVPRSRYKGLRKSMDENIVQAAPHITHIALKVDDMKNAVEFWQQVFGFRLRSSFHQRDHMSVHLTDGAIDLALVDFEDAKTEAAVAAGPRPCIHHFGIDVPERKMAHYQAALTAADCAFISDPGAQTIKFRLVGGGGIGEIAPMGWHFRSTATG